MLKPLERKEPPDFQRFKNAIKCNGNRNYVSFFEMITNYHEQLSGLPAPKEMNFSPNSPLFEQTFIYYMHAMARMGYDYGMLNIPGFTGYPARHPSGRPQAADGVIRTMKDVEEYPWPDVKNVRTEPLERIAKAAPEGMGVLVGSNAVFEIMMNDLIGFDTIAIMLYDKPELIRTVADRIGSTLVEMVDLCCSLPFIDGFLVSGDMGHKIGTMVSPEHLREYILPWHKKACDAAHKHGKLVILHSCGNLAAIMEDIIACGYDGKHSFEDSLVPNILGLHEMYGDRICLLGGIDVDLLCRGGEQAIRRRVREFIDTMGSKGGWMLGSGNSIPDYVPVEGYWAMLDEGLHYGR